jgi:uncharacterized membrane protein YoaK (UPF0700 family)
MAPFMFTKPTPIWITLGAVTLACCAGSVNAVGFLGLQHQALTHMSGTVTNLGMELARGDRQLAQHALLVIVCFFSGCVLSGVIIRHSTLKAGRRYGVALTLESALLFTAAYLFRHQAITGDYLAAMACGLQNAMATTYSGAVIRTTHVTGIVTDLGIAVGLLARREPVDWRRMRLYVVLLSGFFLGSTLGAAGFIKFGYDTILFPATLTGTAGIGFTLVKHYRRNHPPAQSPA